MDGSNNSNKFSRREILQTVLATGIAAMFPALGFSQQPRQYRPQQTQQPRPRLQPQPQLRQQQPQAQAQTPASNGAANKIEYRLVSRRRVMKSGVWLLNSELGIEAKVWDNLRKGLTEQQFYDSLKDAYILSVSDIVFAGHRRRKELLNSVDFEEQLTTSAGELAVTYPQFTGDDQVRFRSILRRNLYTQDSERSDRVQGVYFPPKSKIFIRFGKIPSIEMWVYDPSNPNVPDPKIGPTYITKSDEADVMNKFFRLFLLKEDNQIPDYNGSTIKCPIDRIYHKAYLAR